MSYGIEKVFLTIDGTTYESAELTGSTAERACDACFFKDTDSCCIMNETFCKDNEQAYFKPLSLNGPEAAELIADSVIDRLLKGASDEIAQVSAKYGFRLKPQRQEDGSVVFVPEFM